MPTYVKTAYVNGEDITANKEYEVKRYVVQGLLGAINDDDGFEIMVNLNGEPSAHLDDVGIWTVINRP